MQCLPTQNNWLHRHTNHLLDLHTYPCRSCAAQTVDTDFCVIVPLWLLLCFLAQMIFCSFSSWLLISSPSNLLLMEVVGVVITSLTQHSLWNLRKNVRGARRHNRRASKWLTIAWVIHLSNCFSDMPVFFQQRVRLRLYTRPHGAISKCMLLDRVPFSRTLLI